MGIRQIDSDSVIKTGRCGDKAGYVLTNDGVMTISGTGAMDDGGFLGNNPALKEVIIEDGITGLGSMAFDGCYNLTGVTIPGSVTAIGKDCFEDCDNLTIICNPNSYAEQYAIDEYNVNDVLYLPESTTEVNAEAFLGVAADAIYLPEGCTFVGEDAFADCENLKLIVKPAGLTIS